MLLCWIDTETTGLSPFDDHIIELAILVTDADLEPVADPFNRVMWPGPAEWRKFKERGPEDWPLRQHTASGLVAEIDGTPEIHKIFAPDVMMKAKEWLEKTISPDSPMIWAGSGCHFDRAMLDKSGFNKNPLLSHRNFEMQGFRYAFEHWAPRLNVHHRPPNEVPHRALADIEAQIAMAHQVRGSLTFIEALTPA